MGSWDAFIELVKVFGIPLTMALVAVWAFATGRVVARSTHDEIVRDKDEQIDKLERREQALFDLALTGAKGLEHATGAIESERKKR